MRSKAEMKVSVLMMSMRGHNVEYESVARTSPAG